MEFPEHYKLVFPAPAAGDDTIVVHRTDRAGAGGYPIYEDDSGIVRAEISPEGDVRMMASGGHQDPGLPTVVRPEDEP